MDDKNIYEPYQYGEDKNASSEKSELNETSEVNFILQNPQESEISEESVTESKAEPKYEQYTYEDVNKTENQPKDVMYGGMNRRKKSNKWINCIALAIVFGLVASAVFQVSNRVIDGIFGTSGKKNEVVMNTTPITTTSDVQVLSDVSEVAKNAMPSVVSITCLTVQEVQSYFFGGGYTQQYESSGSGIIIGQNDTELLIVTNNHVVEGSSTVTVTFADETNLEAQIKGTDADIDVAIVAVSLDDITDETYDAIKIANLGDSDKLVVGEPTIAIGNALGYGQSVTNGIVSALGRNMDGLETGLIQTNAAINPGNSGGALLNAAGEVIGINTAKIGGENVEGLGFAIPISDIQEVLSDLMSKETRTKVDEKDRGTIGVQIVSVDETASEMYGMPQGAQVREVIKGGAADKAGIPKGAIITKFDGTRIKSKEDLLGALEYYKAGEEVEVTVQIYSSDGEYAEKVYELKLGKQSDLQ